MLVKYHKENVFTCKRVLFLPGINEVEEGVLDTLLSHPGFMDMVDAGAIEILWEDNINPTTPVDKALKQIKEVFSVEQLHRIKNRDSREEIIKAVDKQIKKIKEE